MYSYHYAHTRYDPQTAHMQHLNASVLLFAHSLLTLKIMFNVSILFKTTTRVIILNILTTYKTYSPIFQGRYLFHLCTPYFRLVSYLY